MGFWVVDWGDMAGNSSLGAAKDARQDEFYTQLSDIENELRHYRKHFKGKVVLCNCDDPFESNFFKYFVLNFNKLGLKKLIATCYSGSPIAGTQLSLFDDIPSKTFETPYKAIVTVVRDATGDGGIDMLDVAALFKTGENKLTRLKGNGDFKSPECLALMDEADIVVTNPPFSLFNEYLLLLVERNKGFVVIGPQNAIHYRDIFPLLKQNKIWLGYGFQKGDAYFSIPRENARNFASGVYDENTGLVHFRNCTWFTNLDIKKRHEELVLVKSFDPATYPRYFNYEAIDVSRVSDIPCDYTGKMGVPDTFLSQYNPEQFEIIGMGSDVPKTLDHVSYKAQNRIAYERDGVAVWETEYSVAERKLGNGLRIDAGGLPGKSPFSRIIIRNRHPESPED